MTGYGMGGLQMTGILREGWRLVLVAPAESAVFVLGTAAAGALSDTPGWERPGMLASSIASLALGYVLVVAMMMKGDLLPGDKRAGFWSYFGLGILLSLGVAVGTLFLVVPGLVLWLRWSAAYGFLFGEEGGVAASLGRSWRATRPHFWPIAAAMLLPLALFVAAMAMLVLTTTEETVSVGASAMINLVISLAGLATTALGLAVFSLMEPRARVSEVFA